MGLATNWQAIDLDTMIFPATFLVDYVRVYQRKGASSDNVNIGCDPPNFPTSASNVCTANICTLTAIVQ